jgi:hypothetical protein
MEKEKPKRSEGITRNKKMKDIKKEIVEELLDTIFIYNKKMEVTTVRSNLKKNNLEKALFQALTKSYEAGRESERERLNLLLDEAREDWSEYASMTDKDSYRDEGAYQAFKNVKEKFDLL